MKVTAIIPAYNEENTVANVVETVKQVALIQQVIVVSDGSTDQTAECAAQAGAEAISLQQNVGKGGAIKAGILASSSDVVLFLDADLIGLTPKHVIDLLMPVLNDEADMTIGIFKNGRIVTDLAQKVTPHLSGQRALKRFILDNMPNLDITRYGVEVALTRYAEANEIRVLEVGLEDMTHLTKEEKLGVMRGMHERIKMYKEIVKTIVADK